MLMVSLTGMISMSNWNIGVVECITVEGFSRGVTFATAYAVWFLTMHGVIILALNVKEESTWNFWHRGLEVLTRVFMIFYVDAFSKKCINSLRKLRK